MSATETTKTAAAFDITAPATGMMSKAEWLARGAARRAEMGARRDAIIKQRLEAARQAKVC
jgi:hypothetical protein